MRTRYKIIRFFFCLFVAIRQKKKISKIQLMFKAYYVDDTGYTFNPFIKFAMCMLVDSGNTKNLLISLPQDVEALVLLYSGDNRNVSSELLCVTLNNKINYPAPPSPFFFWNLFFLF